MFDDLNLLITSLAVLLNKHFSSHIFRYLIEKNDAMDVPITTIRRERANINISVLVLQNFFKIMNTDRTKFFIHIVSR